MSDIAPAALSRDDAARYLSISTDTLDRLRAAGKITAFQAGGRLVRFKLAELDAFMERECLTIDSSRSGPRRTGISSGSKTDTRAALQRALQIGRKRKPSSQHSD